MHYFIDGYNLLFRILRVGDDLQKQREEVIQDLAAKINMLEIEATLVFDAHYQRSEVTRSHLERLLIVFTNAGETADEYILHALKEDPLPSMHTVVTSDNKLAWLARRRLAKTLRVEEFRSWLNRRYKNACCNNKKNNQLTKAPCSPVQPPPKKPPPHAKNSSESYFDFYLERFEKEYLELSINKTETSAVFIISSEDSAEIGKTSSKRSGLNDQSNKTHKKSLKLDDNSISNLERWQKAFERNIAQDEV